MPKLETQVPQLPDTSRLPASYSNISHEHYFGLENRINTLAYLPNGQPRTLWEIQGEVQGMQRIHTRGDGVYLHDFVGYAPGVFFSSDGRLKVLPRFIHPPLPNQVSGLVIKNGVCHTDLDLIDRFKSGTITFPYPLTIGHECIVLITGVGADVNSEYLGQFAYIDSHVACNGWDETNGDHNSFTICAPLGCDGIVSGIKPTRFFDGTEGILLPGYFSLEANIEDSAIAGIMDTETATQFHGSPESTGNLFQIIHEQQQVGVLELPEKTLQIVIGLGATGLPLSIILHHYGSPVIGIEPTSWRRILTEETGSCVGVFETPEQAIGYFRNSPDLQHIDRVVVNVMSGHPDAYDGAHRILTAASQREAHVFSETRKHQNLLIAFGLFPNDDVLKLPGAPEIPQRQVVFSRQDFDIHNIGANVKGVVGRWGPAWELEKEAIGSDPETGLLRHPELVADLNKICHIVPTNGDFGWFTNMINNEGTRSIEDLLQKNHKAKLILQHFPFVKRIPSVNATD